MGNFFSWVMMTNPVENTQNVALAKDINSDDDIRNDDLKEMEKEFDEQYRQVAGFLQRLTHSPCEHAALEIMECIKQNPNKILNCEAIIKKFNHCTQDAVHARAVQINETTKK